MDANILQLIQTIFFSLALAILVFFVFLRITKKNISMPEIIEERMDVEVELKKLSSQYMELRNIVVGLSQQISHQNEKINALQHKIAELENVDQASRLYSRATKMVNLGAGLEELMNECELPKAEAELMMTLQKKMQDQSKAQPQNRSSL